MQGCNSYAPDLESIYHLSAPLSLLGSLLQRESNLSLHHRNLWFGAGIVSVTVWIKEIHVCIGNILGKKERGQLGLCTDRLELSLKKGVFEMDLCLTMTNLMNRCAKGQIFVELPYQKSTLEWTCFKSDYSSEVSCSEAVKRTGESASGNCLKSDCRIFSK